MIYTHTNILTTTDDNVAGVGRTSGGFPVVRLKCLRPGDPVICPEWGWSSVNFCSPFTFKTSNTMRQTTSKSAHQRM